MRFVLVLAVLVTAPGCVSRATVRPQEDAAFGITTTAWKLNRGSRPREPSHAVPLMGLTTCSELGRSVTVNHPRVRAARARAKAALARSKAEGSLPPPTASIEVWDYPIGDPSRSDREGMYMFGVGQEFPAGRRERATAEAADAQVAAGELADAAREIWSEVTTACVDWSAAEAVRARIRSRKGLLVQLREAMLARYRGGADGLANVARAEAELATAERESVEADEEVRVARETLGALTMSSLPRNPPVLAVGNESPDVERSIQVALASRGDLRAGTARQKSAVAKSRAAAAEAETPSFEVRATYMQTPAARAGLGAMFGMSLPWLWGGGPDRRRSAQREVEAARDDLLDRELRMRVDVTRAAGQVRALQRSLKILVEREIPAAEHAVDAARAGLVAGDFSLASWLEAARLLHDARIDEARTRAALARAWVAFGFATGQPLDRGPRP